MRGQLLGNRQGVIQTGRAGLFGGLNEKREIVSEYPGNLIVGENIEESDSFQYGYSTVKGFEVFDGTSPLPSGVAVTLDEETGEVDDTAREARRVATTEIPGVGNPLGGFVFKGDVYVFRNHTDNSTAKMWKSTSNGWIEVVQPGGEELTQDGTIDYTFARFDCIDAQAEIVYFVSGKDKPRYYNGTSIVVIDHENLPTTSFPMKVHEYNNRLILGYSQGSIFFSAVGDPTDFGALGNAGEIYAGDALVELIDSPGETLLVILENSLRFLKSVEQYGEEWIFQFGKFADAIKVIPNTARKLLNNVYFCTDSGVSNLKAVSEFGDLGATSLQLNIREAYHNNKDKIIGAYVDKSKSQYRIVLNTGEILNIVFTAEMEPKSVTKIVLPVVPLSILQGEVDVQGQEEVFFLASTGYCYKLESGTSFNGAAITSKFVTLPNYFKSPRFLKQFTRLEISLVLSNQQAEDFLKPTIKYQSNYSYSDTGAGLRKGTVKTVDTADLPKTIPTLAEANTDIWTPETDTQALLSSVFYEQGVGTSFSLSVLAENKYSEPVVFTSYNVDYISTKAQH